MTRRTARRTALRSIRWRRTLAVVAVTAVLATATGIIVGVTKVRDFTDTLTAAAVPLENQPELPPEIGAYDGAFSLLLAGTDECEPDLAATFGERCTGPEVDAQNNDLTILVHVSEAPRRVTVVTFPRDLMIPIPSCLRADGSESSAMSKQMLNSAYYYGGLSCVVKTVSEFADHDIPFAAQLSFSSVIAITDAIGGVDVCIGSEGIRDRHTGIDWPAGMRSVQGMDALQFLRTRHGVGDESDLARIGNQQQYMSRLLKKIRSEGTLSDPAAMYEFAMVAAQNIVPSEGLASPLRLAQLALALQEASLEDITFVQYPVTMDPENSNRVVPDHGAAAALWAALETNSPLLLTGRPGANGGVTLSPTEAADPVADEPAPAGSVELPQSVSGSTAAQDTCASGNVR